MSKCLLVQGLSDGHFSAHTQLIPGCMYNAKNLQLPICRAHVRRDSIEPVFCVLVHGVLGLPR